MNAVDAAEVRQFTSALYFSKSRNMCLEAGKVFFSKSSAHTCCLWIIACFEQKVNDKGLIQWKDGA